MTVDTEERLGSNEQTWYPPDPEVPQILWKPPRRPSPIRRVLRRVLLGLAVAFVVLTVMDVVGSMLDTPTDDPRKSKGNQITSPDKPKNKNEDALSPRKSLATFAGKYRNEFGAVLTLRKSGSYHISGYWQMGDLYWTITPKGNIFVLESYTDYGYGPTDIVGMTLDPRKGGKVLVKVRRNGEPLKGMVNPETYRWIGPVKPPRR